MTDCILQEAEKVYIIHGIQDNLRSDGRGCLDYRVIELDTDVIPNVNGSALVKVGETKLLVGVKAELTAPLPACPNKGWIEISIESTPHANPEFEGRGGDDYSSDISQLLMQAYNNEKLFDLKSLCVIPGQQVWVLYVDILVLGYGGNLIDVASIATKAALHDTKIQSVTVKMDENNEPELEISDDPYDVVPLNVTDLPCFITLFRVGSEFIVDATLEEESCSKANLVLAMSPSEIIMMKEVGGPGSLHIETVTDILEVGQEMGLTLQKQVMDNLKIEKTLQKKKTSLFF